MIDFAEHGIRHRQKKRLAAQPVKWRQQRFMAGVAEHDKPRRAFEFCALRDKNLLPAMRTNLIP
ncbi:MAG: hypothetical protein WAX67_08495 [Rugosibacter sp.]